MGGFNIQSLTEANTLALMQKQSLFGWNTAQFIYRYYKC